MKIAVIDDHATVRETLKGILEREGHSVTALSDGHEALSLLLGAERPDMVILDLMLPDVSGQDICRRIREHEKDTLLPMYVIVLSARADKDEIARCLDAGANEYITKPFDRRELLARIEAGHKIIDLQQTITNQLAENLKIQERFVLAINGVRDGIWDWNLRTNKLYLSPKWKEIIGYRDDEIPNEFASFESRLHPDDKPRVMKYVGEYLDGKIDVYNIEFRFRHKDGSWRWILARGEALRDENGIPYRMAGSHTDVTERVNAELQLKEKEEFESTLLANLNAGVMIVDPETRVIESVNPKVEKMAGLPARDIIGKVCHCFLCPAMEKQCPILDLGQEVDNSEKILIGPDGNRIPILKTVKKVLLDGKEKLLETFVDISLQKKNEAEVLAQREFLTTIMNTVPIPIFFKDINGIYLGGNAAFAEFLGKPLDEIIGRTVFEIAPEPLAQIYHDADRKLLEGTDTIQIYEANVTTKNGAVRNVIFHKAVYHEANQKPAGIVGAILDITERMESEKESLRHQERAARAEKYATLGTLVSGIGHEINNPAGFIMLNAPVLKELFSDILPILHEHCREKGIERIGNRSMEKIETRIPGLLDGIIEGSERIRDIVKGLRAFAGMDPNVMEEEVSVNEAVKNAVMLVNHRIKAATEKFTLDLQDAVPCIHGNLHRIEQVIINLIINACESLENREEAVTIHTRLDLEKPGVIIEIEDNGTGIDPDNLSKITDPFFTTKRNRGGTGLGLAISQGIVNDHHGKMLFHSVPGEGTTVTVEFPVASA